MEHQQHWNKREWPVSLSHWTTVYNHHLQQQLNCLPGILSSASANAWLFLNMRSARTTLHACESFPIRDSSSCFLQAFLSHHIAIRLFNSCSFYCGSLISCVWVSSMLPRRGRTGEGPSIFFAFSDILSCLHMLSIISMFLSHSVELGLPTVRKSSM